jgi:hypothetical protein
MKSKQIFILGKFQDNPPPINTTLMIADPVYSTKDIDELVKIAVEKKIPSVIFMYPEDIWNLPYKPNQILHWIKPESTKNTSRKYSRFVEVICCYNTAFYGELHWSNRTGIFTDRLFSNIEHPWKKPESLIERLITNHYCGNGCIYDPCAGSRTVEKVCKKLNIECFSVDIKKY